ncbi:MAG: hypothetical protein ACRCRZ_01260 [Metamycoplasmataceae bacterium]
MNYNKIDQHMKNIFGNQNAIKKLKTFDINKINEIKNTEIYKISFATIAIDIVSSVELNDAIDVEDYNKIISEFIFGVSTIFSDNNAKKITIQGDMVFAIFEADLKKDIDHIFEIACLLNTFIEHLNTNIVNFLDLDRKIEAGIGVWFSSENYLTKVGKTKNRDLVFMGDSVNKACKLAKIAARNNYENILFNDLIYNNFTEENKKNNHNIGTFSIYHNVDGLDNESIYGCSWTITKYDNFIKNNV